MIFVLSFDFYVVMLERVRAFVAHLIVQMVCIDGKLEHRPLVLLSPHYQTALLGLMPICTTHLYLCCIA